MTERFYDTPGTQVVMRGTPLICQCGGEVFTVRHIHNPYASDMCEAVARCDACGSEYGDYVGRVERRVFPEERNAK